MAFSTSGMVAPSSAATFSVAPSLTMPSSALRTPICERQPPSDLRQARRTTKTSRVASGGQILTNVFSADWADVRIAAVFSLSRLKMLSRYGRKTASVPAPRLTISRPKVMAALARSCSDFESAQAATVSRTEWVERASMSDRLMASESSSALPLAWVASLAPWRATRISGMTGESADMAPGREGGREGGTEGAAEAGGRAGGWMPA